MYITKGNSLTDIENSGDTVAIWEREKGRGKIWVGD